MHMDAPFLIILKERGTSFCSESISEMDSVCKRLKEKGFQQKEK